VIRSFNLNNQNGVNFLRRLALKKNKNLTVRVAMLLKLRASPDMLPFSLCNKKSLAIQANSVADIGSKTNRVKNLISSPLQFMVSYNSDEWPRPGHHPFGCVLAAHSDHAKYEWVLISP
jgi:hypothetical protein